MATFLSSGYSFMSGVTFVLLALYLLYNARTESFDLDGLGSTRNVITAAVGSVFWPIILGYGLYRLKMAN